LRLPRILDFLVDDEDAPLGGVGLNQPLDLGELDDVRVLGEDQPEYRILQLALYVCRQFINWRAVGCLKLQIGSLGAAIVTSRGKAREDGCEQTEPVLVHRFLRCVFAGTIERCHAIGIRICSLPVRAHSGSFAAGA